MRLHVRDWPGIGGVLVHVPDPSSSTSRIWEIAERLAPRHRVLSVAPRGGAPYQVDVLDLVGVLDQFGFAPVLVGEGIGCVTAVMVAAWYPGRVQGVILVNGQYTGTRALAECPPDWVRLRAAIQCPLLETSDVGAVEPFVAATLP